jgi:multiple sugar transport system permease protein
MTATAPPIPAAPRRRPRVSAGDVAAWAFLILLLAFSVIPMAWMLSTSLKTQFAALQQPPRWIPEQPTLEQYVTLLSPRGEIGPQFLRYFVNSLIVATTTTVLGVLIAIPAAYAFSRFRFPGRGPLFFLLLVRNMFPAVVFLIPLFILMTWLRLVNTYGSLILTYLTFGLPLSIWLL